MHTFWSFVLIVMVFVFPQYALSTEEEEVAIEAFSFPTISETWGEAVDIFFNAMFIEEECMESFFDHTGRMPEEVFLNDDVEMVFPSTGILGDILGMNICAPTTGRSRISINLAFVEILGPQHSANTIIHELVHAANCGEEIDKCLNERTACKVANVCTPVGEDCEKLYRECKREKKLQNKPVPEEAEDGQRTDEGVY